MFLSNSVIILYWGDNMRSEKELFKLAKDMSFINNRLAKENINPLEKEELNEYAKEITTTLLEKNYDVNTFLLYQELYKKMTVAEYYAFIDTLE